MRELLSHSAGFSYGSGHSLVDALYHDQKVMQSHDLHEMVQKLATIPLNYQPGKGVDVQRFDGYPGLPH